MRQLIRVSIISFVLGGIFLASAYSEESAESPLLTAQLKRIQALEERVAELEYNLNVTPAAVRIAYDSGWFSLGANSSLTLHHNVGGNTNRYIVLLDRMGDSGSGWANWGYGGFLEGSDVEGYYYWGMTAQDVIVENAWDLGPTDFRLRIIVY